MQKEFVFRTMEGFEVCTVPMDESLSVQTWTGRLRTSCLPIYKRLRELFAERGIDIGSVSLVQLFPEGQCLLFGIIATDEAKFRFDFDWLNRNSEAEGEFTMWQEMTRNDCNRE